MRGNGGSTEVVADYFFIDSSYVNILMRLGLVVFILVMLIISIIMIKNLNLPLYVNGYGNCLHSFSNGASYV